MSLALLPPLVLASVAAAQKADAPPKVAVVVAGDPDAPLRRAAQRVEALVEATEALDAPVDPALRRALRGEPASGDDGLVRVRGARRALGWSEAQDLPQLVRLGRVAGADAVVVIRRGTGGAELVVVDARAGAFYEGALALADADDASVRRFIRPRADAARSRAEAGEDTPPRRAAAGNDSTAPDDGREDNPPRPESPASGDRREPESPASGDRREDAPPPRRAAAGPEATAPSDGRGGEPAAAHATPPPRPARPRSDAQSADGDGGDDDEAERSWLERNWAYLVAGALLVGTVTFFVMRDRNDGSPQPMLRFRPGGER